MLSLCALCDAWPVDKNLPQHTHTPHHTTPHHTPHHTHLVESLPLQPGKKKLLLIRITKVCPPVLPTYPRTLPYNAPLARSPALSPSRR